MKKFFPVIHCDDINQTRRNLNIASEANVDGVFLINHQITSLQLNDIINSLIPEFDNLSFGINYLDLDPITALYALPENVERLWLDSPGLIEGRSEQPFMDEFLEIRNSKKYYTHCYGSVAFKYQPQPKDLYGMSNLACNYFDVITTSGTATGVPADLEKIKTISRAVQDFGLDVAVAIASGITVDNVKHYLPYVEEFLVATGISYDFFNLNPFKVKELADIIHSY